MPGKEMVPRPAPQSPATLEQPPWQQPQRQREGESAFRTIAKWAKRNNHFTVPLAIPVVLWPAAMILHACHATGIVLVIGAVSSALVAYFAPHKWQDSSGKPRQKEVIYAIASASGASLWLWLATWLKPAGGITGEVLCALLLAGAIAWGIPWWGHKRPRGQRRRGKLVGKWEAWWTGYALHWQLGGSHVINVWETETKVRLHLQGVPGRHSFAIVERAAHLMPSALGGLFPPDGVSPFRDDKDGSRFFLEFRKVNPLAAVVEYDLALAPCSVNDPETIGKDETGQWRTATQMKSAFVGGQTGSGKSNFLSLRIANLSGCKDSWQILIDLKGGRSARPAMPAIDYVAVSLEESRQILRMLVDEITERAARMYFGQEQHVPTEEDPEIHLLIDETYKLTSVDGRGDAECAYLLGVIASQGRAVAIYVDVYTQYGSLSASVRDEQVRSNLPRRVLFKVEQPQHGAFFIADFAKLDASLLEEPGTFFLKDGAKADTMKIRSPYLPHDLFGKICLQNYATVKVDRPPLRLYAERWQDWWNTRWDRLPEIFRDNCPQYAAYIALRQAMSPAQAWQASEDIREAAATPDEPLPAPTPGEGDGASVAARIAKEQAAFTALGDDFRPSPAIVAKQRKTMAGKKQLFAHALELASPIKPSSAAQLAEDSGMSQSWVYQTLNRLVDARVVIKVSDGQYAPASPDQNVAAAVEAIRKRDDNLLQEAKRMRPELNSV